MGLTGLMTRSIVTRDISDNSVAKSSTSMVVLTRFGRASRNHAVGALTGNHYENGQGIARFPE
ncbi:hypothetical protein Y600_5930 [Burkholderia pseudomallei MSHR3709]|nr:hypothetical protein Y600_5930 [Burkholderia pseudomallei MSHR3709]